MIKKSGLAAFVIVACVVCAFQAMASENVYKLGPGDVLEISVWKDEALSRQLVVPPDGVISFPLIKDIEVTGMTVPDLREVVTKKISEFLPDATVTVILVQAHNGMMAYVIGKVNNPGQFPINNETTVMQLLAMARGLTPYASGGKIIILRREHEKTIKIPFDYDEVEKGSNLEQNIIVGRGDIVVVP